MSTPITRDEVARRIETGDVTVVEALPESYYRDGHLPGPSTSRTTRSMAAPTRSCPTRTP